MTPYQKHKNLNHKTTYFSPNGVDQIEECLDCGMRFLHNPCIGYPLEIDKLIRLSQFPINGRLERV